MTFKNSLDHKSYIQRLLGCKLCRNVAFAAFASLVVIEVIILVPSYGRYEQDLMVRFELIARHYAHALVTTVLPENYGKPLSEAWLNKANMMREGTKVRGAEFKTFSGEDLGSFGKTETYHSVTVPFESKDLMITVYLDSAMIPERLWNFILRITGLVLLIAVCVTTVLMVYLNRHVLMPILQLRTHLVQAGEDPAHAAEMMVETKRRDELGDVLRAFNRMSSQVASGVQELDSKVEHLATHDPVTALANASLFFERVSDALTESQQNKIRFSLLHVRLQDFYTQNLSIDLIGRNYILRLVGQRIKSVVPETTTVSRSSGEHFYILLLDVDQEETAQYASKILSTISAPIHVDDRRYLVQANVGIALHPDDGADTQNLMKNADLALSRAEADVGTQICFFVPELDTRMQMLFSLEDDLRFAVKRQEFKVFFQPKIDFSTGKTIGAEALIRWPHSLRGMISPADFIPIAERTGLILPIGMWVLNEACHQLKIWTEIDPDIHVSVNLSTVQFNAEDLVNDIARIIRRSGIRPENLELEITESSVMRDVASALTTLNRLSDLGLRLVIDDFGTGYSSLSYLKKFPVHKIKIDKSFVSDIEKDPESKAIAGAIIDLAHSLKMSVVAEGIETQQQAVYLKTRGCEEGQGFLYGYPTDASDFMYQTFSQSSTDDYDMSVSADSSTLSSRS